MESNFGGPVWHASVRVGFGVDGYSVAESYLRGVGDSAAGEWRQHMQAFHIRRRLSAAEVVATGLVMEDLRHTQEGAVRMRRILQLVPAIRSFALEQREDPETWTLIKLSPR